MEMHQIRYFLALCETLNFTRAAEQCNVAQPSLTRAIKKLEAELGGPLFRRERNRTHCTDLGRMMRPHFLKIIESSDLAASSAQDFSSMDVAQLKLGVMCTIGPSCLVGFLARLRNEVPHLDVQLHDAAGWQLIDAMLAGDLDIAIVGMPDIPDRFDTFTLYKERYVVAYPRGHRFEQMNAVPLSALDREDYLNRVNCEYTEHLEALGVAEEPDVVIRYESERETWIQSLIMAGLGCAVMPEYLPVLPDLPTRVVVEPEIQRKIQLVTVAGRRYSPAISSFIRLAHHYDWMNGG